MKICTVEGDRGSTGGDRPTNKLVDKC